MLNIPHVPNREDKVRIFPLSESLPDRVWDGHTHLKVEENQH